MTEAWIAPLPLGLRLYRWGTGLSAPILDGLLERRARQGKEEPGRLGERRGLADRPRPEGPLVWIHAVSVGEANSVLPLIGALLRERPGLSVLLTTGTRTAARLMAERLPQPRAFHQFIPLDHPAWVARFLAHWRPDLGLIVESELWPNLLLSAERRGIRLLLVNARLSARSAERWARRPRIAARLLACFSACLAQDDASAGRYRALGAAPVEMTGNLKLAADPLPDLPAERDWLGRFLGDRPVWLAASTHPGEEALIGAAHRQLLRDLPGLLTMIVPRHPERGGEIAALLSAQGFAVARRSLGIDPSPAIDVYVADTLGELGLFYRLAPIAFIGGTLVDRGGQNPLEAARLDTALLHGPSTANFAETFAALDEAGGTEAVSDAAALAGAVHRLLANPVLRARRAAAARAVTGGSAQVLEAVLSEVLRRLPGGTHARA